MVVKLVPLNYKHKMLIEYFNDQIFNQIYLACEEQLVFQHLELFFHIPINLVVPVHWTPLFVFDICCCTHKRDEICSLRKMLYVLSFMYQAFIVIKASKYNKVSTIKVLVQRAIKDNQ